MRKSGNNLGDAANIATILSLPITITLTLIGLAIAISGILVTIFVPEIRCSVLRDCSSKPTPESGFVFSTSTAFIATQPPSLIPIFTPTNTLRNSTPTLTLTLTPFPLVPAQSRTPTLGFPARGKIAFHSTREGQRQVYVMNVDGSQPKALTNFRDHDRNAAPSWSPDGTRIAFQSTRDGNAEIYVMNPDGTGQTNLTQYTGDDGDPEWSPDGKMIAFVSNRDGNDEIYLMNYDDKKQYRFTNAAGHDWRPAWSPDGKWIIWMSDRGGKFQIFMKNIQGGNETNLSNNSFNDSSPSWSPDNRLIAFSSDRDGGDDSGLHQIYIMNANGTNQRKLTGNASILGELPAWSMDSRFLAFESYRDRKWEVYKIDMISLIETRLTLTTGDNAHPSWSPQ